MKKPVNLAEILIEHVVEDQLAKRPEVCACEVCKADIMAIALNKTPPRYVNSDKGELYVRIGLLSNQISIDLLVEVSKAIDQVIKNPQH